MAGLDAYDEILRKHRRKPLVDPREMPVPLAVDRTGIRKIIPHREPFLLVDSLTGLDRDRGILTGTRLMLPDDPVFSGHFPGTPVYPGSLEVEMVGQCGLCLTYFLQSGNTAIVPEAEPVPVRATRILGAYFLEPLLPGTTAVLIAQKLDFDGYFARMLGQVVAGGNVCCVTVGEVLFLTGG